jgi:hypothetical protein
MASGPAPGSGDKGGKGVGGGSRTASRRLLKELEAWREEEKDEVGIERLGPVDDEDLLRWEAVINGKGIPGGYEGLSVLASTHDLYMSIFVPVPPLGAWVPEPGSVSHRLRQYPQLVLLMRSPP